MLLENCDTVALRLLETLNKKTLPIHNKCHHQTKEIPETVATGSRIPEQFLK